MTHDACHHCRQLDAELSSARSEAAFFREQTEQLLRVVQMAYDCFPDIPAVAQQVLQPWAQEL